MMRKEIRIMKKDTNKKEALPSTSPDTNFGRTSNFSAKKDERSELRVSTYAPLLLLIPVFLPFVFKKVRQGITDFFDGIGAILTNLLNELFKDVDFLEWKVEIDSTEIVLTVILFIVSCILVRTILNIKKENKRLEDASKTRYYFYDDIIEICTKTKRESFRTIGGIVSVKVTPTINTDFGSSFMTALVALLSFNSKPLWQRKFGFRDVTIVTLGSPSETIVLRDVEDPATLVSNIKKYYPQCNVESFGNGFNL